MSDKLPLWRSTAPLPFPSQAAKALGVPSLRQAFLSSQGGTQVRRVLLVVVRRSTRTGTVTVASPLFFYTRCSTLCAASPVSPSAAAAA